MDRRRARAGLTVKNSISRVSHGPHALECEGALCSQNDHAHAALRTHLNLMCSFAISEIALSAPSDGMWWLMFVVSHG